MDEILVIGSGGHAKVVIDILERKSEKKIVGIVSDQFSNPHFCGYEVIKEADLPKLKVKAGIIAIGDNWVRSKVFEKISKLTSDFKYVSAIHPSAQIGKNVRIGDGTVVMANVVINPDTMIGKHCILNTMSSIDHDCNIKDYVSIAPGSTLGGGVIVDSFSAISLGAKISHGITIGEHTVVGTGAIVVKPLPALVVAYGAPAEIIRKREPGEPYLKS